ncbi:MAG: methyltransferase domain-containing protein [Gammaproteobacteria bacterium]
MNNEPNETTNCEVCGNSWLAPVLNLGSHPMCDDLVPVGDDRICREYPIEILYCTECFTALQRFQVPKKDLFPQTYHYRARFTADVLNGMAELVASCKAEFGSLAGKKVLDIGCNDGSLLGLFRGHGAITLGIEPTGAYRDAEQKGHRIFNEFLSEDIADAILASYNELDFITFTNVFAHIENLPALLGSLKHLLAPQTVIIIENHYLGAVLERHQFDTFYHEHLRTYSCTSFVHMARSLDVALLKVELPSRYGGNIRVFLGHSNRPGSASTIDVGELGTREAGFLDEFAELRKGLQYWRRAKQQFIRQQVRQYGKLRAKAFPGRAAILIRLLELNEDSISAVYEKPGSLKIGHYVPGTRIPICSDESLFTQSDLTHPVLNLAWHIPLEIRSYMTDHGYSGPVIDITRPEDFAPEQ